MATIPTAALLGLPLLNAATKTAQRAIASGLSFASAVADPPPAVDGSQASAGTSVSSSAEIGTQPAERPLVSLLEDLKSLVAQVSDNSTDVLYVESDAGNDSIQFHGSEPLASTVREWVKLHPDWEQQLRLSIATTGQQKLSARVTADRVGLIPNS